ncbi:hypothetical protein AMJ71_10295 [candidate division TA06 bacterium SM1_40]|uniref:ABC transporter domain-containing protein n=1 Tax=candidate division TA06 bacterium SM1_40 TaxID=1703773 RepID=A0A0S8JAV5_UNCT6|nr:MAG: hypothetical protein AMJ71_10295 [candidate division TA06 bacterium SM1_40]
MNNTLVDVKNVTKDYRAGKVIVHALRGLDLAIHEGDFMSIVGPSGSGKTTLLNLVGALDTATSGEVSVFGNDLSTMGRRRRADLRLKSLGFVFQAYNLIPVLTARENVEFVLELQGVGSERRDIAFSTLDDLGMGDLADRQPNELFCGQQQRVAVASRPRLVLADEPTANLDSENAEALLQMMRHLRDEQAMTFVFSTHDPLVVSYASRVVTLRDGRVVSDELKDPTSDAHEAGN